MLVFPFLCVFVGAYHSGEYACHTCWRSPYLHRRYHGTQAHNLEDSAREAASAKMSLRALANAAGEMDRLGAKCELLLFEVKCSCYVCFVAVVLHIFIRPFFPPTTRLHHNVVFCGAVQPEDVSMIT